MFKVLRLLLFSVGALLALNLVVSLDKDGNPTYTEWTKEQKDALYGIFKLFDPNKAGIDRAWLKKLNKGVGTNDLQKGLDALKADGLLESRNVAVPGVAIKVETFFWKGA